MTQPAAVLQEGAWRSLHKAAAAVRRAVFVVEQQIPESLEWDEFDALALHVVIEVDGVPAATGRLLPDGRIGRMAVRVDARGRGLGGRVLEHLVGHAARRGDARVTLSAQVHAIPFYARHGFVPEGEVYDDAGIPHRNMTRELR